MDVKTREGKRWQPENGYPSEPVFVPSPNATEEDDGKNLFYLKIVSSGVLYM